LEHLINKSDVKKLYLLYKSNLLTYISRVSAEEGHYQVIITPVFQIAKLLNSINIRIWKERYYNTHV